MVGFAICLSSALLLTPVATLAAVAGTLKVMTFNIKSAAVEIGFDQHESWDYIWNNDNDRRSRVVNVINDSLADIVGVQELRLGQLDYMDARMSSYAFYGVGRSAGTTSDSSERSGIFYKKERFRPIAAGEFWLSETPDTPGTTFAGNGGDLNNPRMATWMKLLDFDTELTYFVINTHWSLDSEARRLSGQLMRDKIIDLADGLPIIATGDMNERATGAGYTALARRRAADEFQLANSYALSGAPTGKTFHGYDGGVEGTAIDFVLHSEGHFQATSGAIVRTWFGGYYPSDHYPVEVTLNVLAPPIPGDYNGDRQVTTADYALWRSTFGSSVNRSADGNGNGVVDTADYVFWRNIYSTAQNLDVGQFAVPEAGSMTLALVLVLVGMEAVRRQIDRDLFAFYHRIG